MDDLTRQAAASLWRWSGWSSRWKGRRLALTLAGGSIVTLILRYLRVLTPSEQARPLSLVFLSAAFILGCCFLGHRHIDYDKQGGPDWSNVATLHAERLADAVRHEIWLASYFLVAWAVEHFWPSGSLEFVFAALGYAAYLRVCGRIHRLAAKLELPSLSAAILRSQRASEFKDDLQSFKPEEHPDSAPPLVNWLDRLLGLLPPVGKASAVMSLLATCIAGVAFANAVPAAESLAPVVRTLVGGTSTSTSAAASAHVHHNHRHTDPPITPAAGSNGAASTPSAEPSLEAPTYEALCGLNREPGRGAPEPAATRLYGLWLGPQGVGGLIGGCVTPAHRIRAGSAAWYAAGYARSALVSLGIANADGTSALALGKPAQFAASQAEHGTLESVSPRVPVGYRDLETVDTQSGTYVFVRMETLRGAAAAVYTVVPPGLVGAWLAADQTAGWVWPVAGHTVGTVKSFTFVTPSGQEVGVATCTGDLSCTSTIRGTTSATSVGQHIAVGELTAIAPEAAG